MSKIIFKEESYKIIGACFRVYKEKGCGFTEAVYNECLKIEFAYQGIPMVSEPQIQLGYRGQILEQHFKPDFICFDKIILEIKATASLVDLHRSQTLNYLHAAGLDLALLVNFGHYPKIEYERIGNRNNYRSAGHELNSWTIRHTE